MGLGIAAYGYLRPAPDGADEGDYHRYWRPGAALEWAERTWPGRTEGVEDRLYAFLSQFSFRAGSYSGYGEWRDWLARVAGFRSAEEAWKHGNATHPFFELIHFADNEGVIGPVVAAKLANDFRSNLSKALELKPPKCGDWYLDQYARWWVAFMLAARCGAVEFC